MGVPYVVEVLFVRDRVQYPSVVCDNFHNLNILCTFALPRSLAEVVFPHRHCLQVDRSFYPDVVTNLCFEFLEVFIVIYWIENACLLTGRFLLGVYFILPGISKITGYEGTAVYMADHNVPFVSILLPVTIVLQIGLGLALMIGLRGKVTAFLLAGMTLVISLFMHNFWDYAEGMERNHETQNFFKNMGIMAGLLFVAALGTGRFSLDGWLGRKD